MSKQVLSITQINEYIRGRMDADPLLTEPLVQLCREAGVCITEVRTMKELGRACAIAVGTAAAAIVAK